MIETATFAAGCFWGVEQDFIDVPGVIATRVGYCGGHTDNPQYKDVCSHNTGHAEAVEVTFDSDSLDYSALLKLFWGCHDPTQVNRQGADIGEQYRSVIFFHSEAQRLMAVSSKAALEDSKAYRRSIATQIVPVTHFWEAEAYHQKYHMKNGGGCGF